jgi:hypothetical protein
MEVTPIAQNPNFRYATLVLVRAKVIEVDSAGLRLSPLSGNVKTGTNKKTQLVPPGSRDQGGFKNA